MTNLLRLLTVGLLISSLPAFTEDGINKTTLSEHWYDDEFWQSATPQDVQNQIAQGADPNDPIMIYSSPLHKAAWYSENPEIIIILLEAGADVNARTRLGGTSALHDAAANNKNPTVIAILIKAGADVNARDSNSGLTPLHYAAKDNKNPSVVKTLVKAGADVNARNSNGITPLHEAAGYNKNPAMIMTLIEAGAYIDSLDRAGMSPLQLAASLNKNPAIITVLVNGGADINAQGSYGSPLHYALKFDNMTAVRGLLEAGANPQIKDKWGNTAFDLIRDNDSLIDTDIYRQLNDLQYQ